MIISTTIFVLLLVFISPGILSLGIRYIPGNEQPYLNRSEKIYYMQSVSQTFISPEDRLTGIGVSLKNPNLANKMDITLTLSETAGVIRQTFLNGAFIQDGKFVKFIFEPVIESKNKNYKFLLSSATLSKDGAMEVFYTFEKPPNAGRFLIGEREATDSAISFVTFHKPESRIALLTEIYSGWLGRLTKDTGFFVIYILILAGLSGYLIFNHKRK